MYHIHVFRYSGNVAVRNPGPPRQPTEKEKYFLQQQAKLKQFGRGSMESSSLDPTKLVDSVFGTDSSRPKPQQGNTRKMLRYLPVSFSKLVISRSKVEHRK